MYTTEIVNKFGDIIKVNNFMMKYMENNGVKQIKNNAFHTELFKCPKLEKFNVSVKNGNTYSVDKYGLPMRKSEYESKKTPFGWAINEQGEPINIHINYILVQTSSNDIKKLTLQYLKSKFGTLFKGPKGVIYKLYQAYDPTMKLDAL